MALIGFFVRILAIGLFLIPAAFPDQVTLKNGDTISGSIVKKDGDKLTIKSEFLGEVTMSWTAVTSVKSDTPLVVGLAGGNEVSGKVTTKENSLVVETPARPVTAPISEITVIRGEAEQRNFEKLLAPNWLNLWAGYFDLGLALTRGNARTDTLSTAFNVSRITRKDKTTLYFNQIYSTAAIRGVTGATAEAVRGGIAYDHNLDSRLFLNVFNDYEYDRFQSLDLRFVLGGGLGFHAIKNERAVLDLLAGLNYNRENFTALTRNSAEVYWGDVLTYKLSGVTSLSQSYRMFNNLSETGEYRINFDVGAVTTLRKWLSWQVTASDRFLSNPIFGRKRNDILLTTGFRVNFAR